MPCHIKGCSGGPRTERQPGPTVAPAAKCFPRTGTGATVVLYPVPGVRRLRNTATGDQRVLRVTCFPELVTHCEIIRSDHPTVMAARGRREASRSDRSSGVRLPTRTRVVELGGCGECLGVGMRYLGPAIFYMSPRPESPPWVCASNQEKSWQSVGARNRPSARTPSYRAGPMRHALRVRGWCIKNDILTSRTSRTQ